MTTTRQGLISWVPIGSRVSLECHDGTSKFFGLWPPRWKCWFFSGSGKALVHAGDFFWNPKFLMYMKWVHESETRKWLKLSYDDSHKNDPKLYRSLGDDPTVTNQQKSPIVTRYQPLKMSQQTHGIPKKERPRMTKRRMLRSSPKAGQKGTNIFPMIQMYRDHWLTRWWQLKYRFF